MFRFSLNSVKFLLNDCTIQRKITKNTQLFYSNILTRLLHTSDKNLKKKGDFVDVIKNEYSLKQDKKSAKVKLYPGFQDSVEDNRNQQRIDSNEMSAKKVIEDFYGLNELEFEKADENEFHQDEESFSDENVDFDIDFVVKTLQNENVQDLCCIQIPKEINYADYMVIGTCLSDKHLNSTFLSVNRKYKSLKTENNQYLQRKTGKETKWCALDTGKVVIHLFLEDYRDYYDLESLWSCGVEFDEKYIEFTKQQSDIQKRLLVTDEENIEEKNA